MSLFIARNLTFYPDYIENNSQELSDEIIIPSFTLNKLMEKFQDNEVLYVNIINTHTNQHYLVTIGSSHNYDKNIIFLPQWILELIGCTGCCDSVIKIEKAKMDDILIASKIIIKPLDPIAFEINTLELFEKALMNIHSIKENIIIPILVPQLGNNYSIFAHIEKVEPMSMSRISNGEVDVEFINDFISTGLDSNPVITPNTTYDIPQILPPTVSTNQNISPIDEITSEERRTMIRDSWLKRFNIKPKDNI
jgi:hypothetical protein